jgi:hypothetical protein
MRHALPLFLAAVFCACPEKKVPPPPEEATRCEVDLTATGLFSAVGNGAHARVIESADDGVPGPFSQGVPGDFLLENDKIRVVVQRPLRQIGPNPYGGTIIDADLKRAAGQPGRDQLGKLEVLYGFGRTINVKKVEVLQDGSSGGPAVIAATGEDAVNDYINVPNIIGAFLGGVKLVTDPNAPLTVTATTYYVLSPHESRVRLLTAFCNVGRENIVTGIGDLFEQGGQSDFFNPGGCSGGLGASTCAADPSPWYGYQSDEVAYAVRGYKISDPKTPESTNALLYVTGVVGTLSGADGQQGLLTWVDPSATKRPGAFAILAGGQRNYLRDLFIGRDLGDTLSQMTAIDGFAKARLNVNVSQLDTGAAASGVRVAVIDATSSKQKTVLLTDKDGKAKVDLPPGNYQVSAGDLGHAIEAFTPVTLPSSGEATAEVKLGLAQKLSVSVKEAGGTGLSAKVTVRCPSGPCPHERAHYRPFFAVDDTPSNIAAIIYVPASGSAEAWVPPGKYEVFVTRGPEYSAFPDTFPNSGFPIDLTTGPKSVSATLARVVDTTGWMSADLHVHAVASADSSVLNSARIASYLAEGVDILVSTDHDVVTDFGPEILSMGAQEQMASMIGCEVTPFDFGHQQAYPVIKGEGPNGGAFDWAGGDGPTLRLDQIYAGLRATNPNVVLQMNHPRGRGGSISQLKVDTATGATHEKPETFRMEPNPLATENDTHLLSNDFDAIEVANGVTPNAAVLNDWLTFLSRGAVKTATGVSDSHNLSTNVGGYSRTWVRMGIDKPSQFDSAKLAVAMKAHRAISSSGQFITLTAQKLTPSGTAGPLAQIGDTLSIDAAAGDKVELTVDVQAPEWMNFDSIELYTFTTGREAVRGEPNASWPDDRIFKKWTYDPTTLQLEPVPGLSGFRRLHVTEKHVASPAADTWYVAMVRGGTASRSLAPLAWGGVACTGGVCTASESRPWGLTNAVLIDADNSGAYDNVPLKITQPLKLPTAPPRPAPPRRVPSLEELQKALKAMVAHDHSQG